MSTSSWIQRRMVVALGMALMLPACTKGGDDARTAQAPPKKPDPAEVMELAKSYDFVNPQGPVAPSTALPDPGVPEADAPTMTIARAVPKVSPAPAGKVIMALVHSDKAYKQLGIEAGDNYIWRDSTDSDNKKWETYMVPASAGSDPKKMKRAADKFSDGDHTEPRLVRSMTKALLAFGACLEDPACGSGHCGYGDVDG